MHGCEIFFPEQLDGQGSINHDSYFNDTTEICGKIKFYRKNTQCIHLHTGNKGNVWTSPSRTDITQLPGKTPRSVCITTLKKPPRTMETQQLNNKFYLVSQ